MSIWLKKSLARLDCKPGVKNVDCILFRISYSRFQLTLSIEEMGIQYSILKKDTVYIFIFILCLHCILTTVVQKAGFKP